ncbi:MAG: RNA 2'-phosphotransferase [Clostridia bacterium]|nr:RNA 2'-phosphotransferase [Clostridia bacterium]
MAGKKNVSVYLSYLLRHHPEDIGLDMDRHGWVSVDALIDGICRKGKHTIDRTQLEDIVAQDEKGRYRFNEEHTRIKACQGHSIPWVEPEMVYMAPPQWLYHGTTTSAAKKIEHSGAILKMKRHAVHLQDALPKAWQSAIRWELTPVVLKIDARRMHEAGYIFGKTDNDVWCTERVPAEFIAERIYHIG